MGNKKINKEKDEIFELIMAGKLPYIPCVHCGYCCNKVPCAYAVQFGKVDENKKCTMLYKDGDNYLCHWGNNKVMRENLAMGAGCCSSLNSTRRDKIEKDKRKNVSSGKNI